jgi:uncharacterized protein (TIGR02246 family)
MTRRFSLLLALLLTIAGTALAQTPSSNKKTSNSDEAAIRDLYDNWAKAFRAHDIDRIMSFYVPGDELVAYDVVPPLQYKGNDAYRKDYVEFLNQFDGPIDVDYREMRVYASGDVGFVHALERFSGKMKNGQPLALWLRATSGVRKINGKWLIVHDHISVPVDFDTGKAALDLKP